MAKAHMTFKSWWDTELLKMMDSVPNGMSDLQAMLSLLDYIKESDIMNVIDWSDVSELTLGPN